MKLNPENKFFSFMSLTGDLILLNLLFLITCIPVVTAGTSAAALYAAVKKRITGKESYIIRDYFSAWKTNFKNASVIWLILLFIILLMSAFTLYIAKAPASLKGTILYTCLFLLLSFSLLYTFPLQATFVNTPLNILRNSCLTAFCHLPWSLLLFFTTYAPLLVTLVYPSAFYYLAVYWLLTGFSLCAVFSVIITGKVFSEYTN